MKLILAVIQHSKLEAVKEALNQVEVFRLTIVDVQGFGRQKGHSEVYRGHELTVQLLRKVQLQIAVNEDFVEPTARSSPPGEKASTAVSALNPVSKRGASNRATQWRVIVSHIATVKSLLSAASLRPSAENAIPQHWERGAVPEPLVALLDGMVTAENAS